ncbi:MAG: SLC13 family permease, partial [Planctomycetota bacterium]|nr:SLC13 family permease [Planctomycetota bacterium]
MIGFLYITSEGGHEVPGGVTMLFAALLVGMIACLALEEKLHAKKSIIVGIFAIVAMFLGAVFGLLPFEDATHIPLGGHEISLPIYIPAIDWGVIAIIVGSSLFVDVTSRSGLFSWIAIKLTKLSGGDPVKLLWLYGLMTVVFSAVLNNVTAMIIVGSLTGVSLNKLGKKDLLLGFLLTMGLLTNIGGLLTLISSVPNIIVGTTAGISFVTFFIKASPYVLVATVLTIWMGAKIFGIKPLNGEDEIKAARELVEGFDENDGIESKGFFYFGAFMLLAFICVIATTSVLPYISNLGMGFVALAFAGIMLLRFKHDVNTFYRSLDWDLMAFFCALFMVIYVMEQAQVLAMIGVGLEQLISLGDTAGSGAILIAAAAASSVTDN